MKKNLLLSLCCGLLLTGCQTFNSLSQDMNSADTDYHHSQDGRRLSVPAGLSQAELRDYFIIPHLGMNTSDVAINDLPPTLSSTAALAFTPLTRRQMRIKRDSEGHTIMLVRTTPEEAWSAIDYGLQQAGYKITVANHSQHKYYILDTAKGKTLTEKSDVFQVALSKVEHGTQVVVLGMQGQALTPNVATKVLTLTRRGILEMSPAG
jgi:uncharacterized lipoprotein